MAIRAKASEANKTKTAVMRAAHRSLSAHELEAPSEVRMPSHYNAHDIEVMLEALWTMFTESQSRKLKVIPPWSDDDEPLTMSLSQVAGILERWLTEAHK